MAVVEERTRRAVPRSAHAEWTPAPDRGDPVDVLRAQARDRLPELVPLRYGRMLASPFAFFRGGAAIMAADLAPTPVSGVHVQLCGDAHLSNFGGFAAPDRTLVFDVNDFDETLPGPWEWDLKRLAASVAIAGRDLGFDRSARRTALDATTGSYRRAMADFATMRTLDLWYARLEIEPTLKSWAADAKDVNRKRLDRTLDKVRHKDSLRALAKLTHEVDGALRIKSDPPLIVPYDEIDPARRRGQGPQPLFEAYRASLPDDRRHLIDRFRPIDYARKVVGVGSVGTDAWIVLLIGNDTTDPLFLQVKEAGPSVLEPYLRPSGYATSGQRVVEGQRLMQAASDVLLGWLPPSVGIDGRRRAYYVRQLWDAKGSVELARLSATTFADYGRVCGWTLARAHARSGDRAAIAAYIGTSDRLDRALARFAETYADQNERDYERLVAAVDRGEIEAAPDPR
ncbi:DUF2252 domain-containing protein [Solirubrobacter soli]|uniref:DUF2252 domain-containing protein n=1 Tax=Solirubrobacter soli TaxID=363832 RepID=UPI0004040558|nr:DUF2252 domain-containing protein [Solirubrobacter soli]